MDTNSLTTMLLLNAQTNALLASQRRASEPAPEEPEEPRSPSRLGGWARVVLLSAGPPLLYAASVYLARWLLPPPIVPMGWFWTWCLAPLVGAVFAFAVGMVPFVVWLIVRDIVGAARRWIRAGFEADDHRSALRAPDHPSAGQVSIAKPVGGELSEPR